MDIAPTRRPCHTVNPKRVYWLYRLEGLKLLRIVPLLMPRVPTYNDDEGHPRYL